MLTEIPTYDDLLHTLRTPDVEFTASWDTRWLDYGPCTNCGDPCIAVVTWSEPIYETHGRYDDDGPFDVEVDYTDEELLACYGCLQTTLDHVLAQPQREDPCIEVVVCGWWLHFAGMPHTHIDNLRRLKALVLS